MTSRTKIAEAVSTLLDDLVDPREAFLGDDGQIWSQVGTHDQETANAGITSENALDAIRAQCRSLAATNEFAINGHENRISYIVGTGHSYRAIPRDAERTSGKDYELADRVNTCIEEFLEANAWPNRQQEIQRRMDRDGECFLRFFPAETTLLVRFVEPTQVSTPTTHAMDPNHAMGIETEPDDAETPVAYWVDGESVPAADIQHRKSNVDGNVRRGLPLFYPVRKNLRRAEKLLRNMTAAAEIQTAIALVRKHEALSSAGASTFVSGNADYSHTDGTTGRTTYYRQLAPGTIIDAPRGVTYDFPAQGLNAANFTEVLRAELRAIAARLVMPEYMFTSDVSSSNYASTIAASGPAWKMFERLASTMVTEDRAVIWRVLNHAISIGKLPANLREQITINIRPPSLITKDPLQEARINEIAHRNGILSPQTWTQKLDLDYDQEQANIANHKPSNQGGTPNEEQNPLRGYVRPVLRAQ